MEIKKIKTVKKDELQNEYIILNNIRVKWSNFFNFL